MKVLLDEHLPLRLRRFFPGHDVFTVEYLGWKGTRNGALLAEAVAAGFQAFITMDDPMTSQQRLAEVPLCIIVLHAPSNALEDLLPLLPEMHRVLRFARPRSVVHVGN